MNSSRSLLEDKGNKNWTGAFFNLTKCKCRIQKFTVWNTEHKDINTETIYRWVKCKNYVTPLLMHWIKIFLTTTYWYEPTGRHLITKMLSDKHRNSHYKNKMVSPQFSLFNVCLNALINNLYFETEPWASWWFRYSNTYRYCVAVYALFIRCLCIEVWAKCVLLLTIFQMCVLKKCILI